MSVGTWISFLVAIFLLMGAFFIVSEQGLHLSRYDELSVFYAVYYHWISGFFTQGSTLTGNVVSFDWLPSNIRVERMANTSNLTHP